MTTRNLLLALAAFTLCAAMTAFAHTQNNSTPSAATPPAPGVVKTVVGCLTGLEGRYTLGTSTDQLYMLEGDPDLLKRYNAVMVRATGTVTEPAPGTSKNNVLSQQPPTMVVTKLKKIADGCN